MVVQRLRVRLHQAVAAKATAWDPIRLADDVTAVLAFASGRLIRATDYFALVVEGKEKLFGGPGLAFKHHPSLTTPIDAEDVQRVLDELLPILLSFSTDEEFAKRQCVMRAVRLYRDALIVAPHDVDTAYVLLVAAGETLATMFSTVSPTFEDVQKGKEILELMVKHAVTESLIEDLKAILTNRPHLKLRAKFVDVISRHLPTDFFESPPALQMPVGYIEKTTQDVTAVGWAKRDRAPWFMKREQLPRSIRWGKCDPDVLLVRAGHECSAQKRHPESQRGRPGRDHLERDPHAEQLLHDGVEALVEQLAR